MKNISNNLININVFNKNINLINNTCSLLNLPNSIYKKYEKLYIADI